MSGAAYDFPGDVEVPELSLLIEAKVYAVLEDAQGDEYIRFKLGWVPKIKEEAERAGFKHSVVIVRGKSRQKRYAVLDFDDYLKLFGTP